MSHPNREEVVPMIESTPGSSRKESLPVLRVDLTKPSRTSGSTRTSVDYLYSQVSPHSPLLSADRLSVKFAPEVFDFQDIEMEKVRFNKENIVTDGEDDNDDEEEEAAVGEEEEEEEEEEDYSASVSAILLRRASSRRQTKRRRPSSAFSPDELGLPRRRSSVVTTTSAETAISIDEGVTEEHIFQNIRLHKEVLSSVKQQPWPMRKKIKLVKQAKKYVKRHEGELQERLAQSKTTRDMLACCDILFVKEWQFAKRELANLIKVMVPWELRIKEIESHFGSVVASYFTFLRWLFWVNLMISLILLTFVAIPEVFLADHKDAGERKKPLPDETANSTKLITLWDFEGVLKYSPLFYGYYNSKENSKRGYGYKGPLAYFITGIAVYIYSFVATLKRMAQNSRQSKLSEKDDECVFTWKLFTGWDYMIGNTETAHNRTASIILGFKEALLEEAEKKRDERSWKMLALRALINLCVLGLFAFSVFAVVSVVKRSANPQNEARRGWWKQNEVTIIVSLITNVFPFLFEILGSMERYHPRKRLRMQLGRIMVLNLLNLYTFIFASFSKINDKTVQLQKIKESLINMTLAASMTLKSVNVTPTMAAVANTIVDDSREAHSTARRMNCTRVMRCLAMTTQSTTDVTSTSISSLATLLLLTSSTIGTPSNLINKNSTFVLTNNATNTFETSPQFISNPLNNTNVNSQISSELEDNDNEIWKLLLPNLSKPSSIPSKSVRDKNISTTLESPKDSAQRNFSNHSIYPEQNKSFPQDTFEPNWLIDKIKVVVNTQYNVTDIDENNQTRPFDYDILNEIDYDLDKNLTIYSNNDTYVDFDLMNDTSTTSSYEDFENQTGESSPTTDDGCYYETVCTEWSPNGAFPSTPELPVEVTTDNIDQKALTTYTATKTTELPTNVDLSLETHRLNITMRRVLRNLCWETVFGQELVKLTVMDLVLTIISTLMVDFIRALFVRVMNNCWCWDLEKKFPQYGDFKIAENILHLVNNQGMVWMGMFFSPGLPLINLIKLAIMMYLRSWAVLTCNVPHEVVFRASRSNNFYLALLLTMLFLCVLPVSYAIVWVEPSWHCGPFSNYPKIYYLFTNSTKNALPKELHHTLDYIASPGIVIPLLMLLILIIYYLISLTNSLREANNDLKVQLRRERTEERRKVFQMVDRKHRGDFSGDLIDNTPFHKWQKTLTILPNKTSTDSPSDTVPITTTTAHAHAVNGDLKSDAKKLMTKLTKHAKLKTSGEQDERSFLLDDTYIDVEPVDTSPIEVDNQPMKSKHQLKQTDVMVDVHSRQSPITKIDQQLLHHQTHQDHAKKKEVSKSRKHEDDNFKAKGEKRTDSITKKHKRKRSASSASSEDIPEIVITHTASTDSLLDGGKPFDQSKSSSIDTVIESGECQKESPTGKKTSEKKEKNKDKISPLHKPHSEKKENQREQKKDKEMKNKVRAEGKLTKDKYEDVDDHEQKKMRAKKHSSKDNYDKRKEDSSGQETENERKKRKETEGHHSHKNKNVDSSKRSSKNEKQVDDTEKMLVTPKNESEAVDKFVKDKKYSGRESVDKDYSTESSIEKSKKKREQKQKKIFVEKEVHETPSKNTKSKDVAKIDSYSNDSNLDHDDVHTSKGRPDQRSSLQKSERGSRKSHKTNREDRKKHDVSKSDESGSKEETIKENEFEEVTHKNIDVKESDREILSSEDEPGVGSKKGKKKREDKIHSVETSRSNRVRKDTDVERSSISTESSIVSGSRKKYVEVPENENKKLRKETERDSPKVPFSSNLKNKAHIKSTTAEEQCDVVKKVHKNSKEDANQSRNESKSKANKMKESKRSSKQFTEDICNKDEKSIESNKTVASRRDSMSDDSEDTGSYNSDGENKSNTPTKVSPAKPKSKKGLLGATGEDTVTNEPDNDSLVSDYSGKSSDSESKSGNEKLYHSKKHVKQKHNKDGDHGGEILDSKSGKGYEQQGEDSDSNSDVNISDHYSSSSQEESQ